MENNEEVILTIITGHKKLKSQFYGLNRKNARNNGFKNKEIVKLTLETDSSLWNTNICYSFLNLPIPIVQRGFF